MLHGSGLPATHEAIRVAADELLYYSTGNPTQTVSKRCVRDWIYRHSGLLKALKTKPSSAKRLDSHVVEEIEEHVHAFKRCKDYWGIHDDDVYNFHETGFQIGVTAWKKVIVPTDTQVAYSADPDNRELITSVETVNYGGRKVPPLITFAGAYHLRRYFNNNNLDDKTITRLPDQIAGISTTDSALNTSSISTYLLNIESHSRGKYRILIFDGQGSHLNFLDFCWQHHVRPFLLLPHTTHLLQPLDEGVHIFKKEVCREAFHGAREISRMIFFRSSRNFMAKRSRARRYTKALSRNQA